MSEHDDEQQHAPLDPSTLTLDEDAPPFPPDPIPFPVPTPDPDAEHITPDHTASAEPHLSLIERVKQRARDNEDKDAPKRASKPKKRVPASRPGALVKPLTEIYTSVGVMIVPFDVGCGSAVVDNAQRCAESLDALAQRNDSVRRALLALTETSAWGGVLTAHLPLLLMIATHHAPKDVAQVTAPLAFAMNPNNPLFQPAPEDGEQRAG